MNKNESCYLCRCVCGLEKQYRAIKLTSGRAQSCGCKRKQKCAEHLRRMNTTHGMTGTDIWKAWHGIFRRLRADRPDDRKYYHDRGITIHPALLTLEAFLAEVGPCPGPGYSIDRINNDLGYEPGNLRWATPKQQSINRRSTIMIEHGGKTQCVTDWAKELDISYTMLIQRVKAGWPIAKALYEPSRTDAINRKSKKLLTHNI